MNFILYSDINERSIGHNLGRPEYSYYFVLKAYRPILESLGQVHLVQSTDEVDPLYRQLHEQGEDCLFSPSPTPHKGGAGPAMPDAVRGRLGVRDDSRRGVGRRSGAGLEPGPGRPWRSHHPLRADCPRGSPGAGRRFSGTGAADADLGGLRRDPPARRTESGQVRRDPATQGLRHRQPPAGPFRRRPHRTDQGRDRGRDPRGPPETPAEPEPEPVPEPEPEPEPVPLDWRRRLVISKHYLLLWYREAVSDLVPIPVRRWLFRHLRRPLPPPPTALETLPEPLPQAIEPMPPAEPEHPPALLPAVDQHQQVVVDGWSTSRCSIRWTGARTGIS